MRTEKLVYTPKGPYLSGRRGCCSFFRRMLSEAFSVRELSWRLFVRDFSARYRQSVLGIGWAILMPLVTVGTFIVMNQSGVLSIGEVGVPYPLYALTGLSIWSLFAVGVSACTSALINAGSMVVKINFPKSALLFAACGQGLVEFAIRAVMIGLAFVYYGEVPNFIGVLLGLLFLIPICLMMLGIGFVLSLVACVLRDAINALNLLLLGLMLLTPILYPISGDSLLAVANSWNPFNYLVNVPRDLIIYGDSRLLSEFFWVSLLAVGVFCFGWRLFYLAQAKIAERI